MIKPVDLKPSIILKSHVKKCRIFHMLQKREITHLTSDVEVMNHSSVSQPESDPHNTERWDLMNTLGLFKPTRICVNLNLSEAPISVSLSRQSSNVFPAECKEDEILSHTTLLFLLRSKSPLRPSGVNKGRCSKWYANWKKKKKNSTNQLASPVFPTLHILKENSCI